MSLIGFGGSEIGMHGTGAAPETVEAILKTALDAGVNVVDTAECYRRSEELIGDALRGRRDEVFLMTKCGHPAGLEVPGYGSLRRLGRHLATRRDPFEFHPKIVEQSLDRSLTRLRTDRVDLVQLHGCPADLLRQGDVVAVLEEAKRKGKTRFIGYSGDGADALHAIESGAFDVLQTSINVADQQAITLTVPRARDRNMGVIAKRAIANAAWTAERPKDRYLHTYWERFQKLRYPFVAGGAAAATALRFTLSIPGVHVALVGTTKPPRLRENAALLEDAPTLPEDEVDTIRARWRAASTRDWVGQT